MPAAAIKKKALEGEGSVPALEAKWKRAKKKARQQGQSGNYAYVNAIFEKMAAMNRRNAILDHILDNPSYRSPDGGLYDDLTVEDIKKAYTPEDHLAGLTLMACLGKQILGTNNLEDKKASFYRGLSHLIDNTDKTAAGDIAVETATRAAKILTRRKLIDQARNKYQEATSLPGVFHLRDTQEVPVDKHAAILPALKLGKKVLGMHTFMSGLGTATDSESRERHGILGTFSRKMTTPKNIAVAAGATVASPLVSKGLTKGFGGVASMTGSKTMKGAHKLMTGSFDNAFSKGVNKALGEGFTQKASRFATNPFAVLGAPSIAGTIAGVKGPWSASGAFWDEDSTVYSPLKGKNWQPYASTSEHDPYRSRNILS